MTAPEPAARVNEAIRTVGRVEYRLRALRYQFLRYVLRVPRIESRSTFYGLRFRAITTDRHARILAKRGATEGPLTRALLALVRTLPGEVMLDIGANLGWYSCVFGRAFPNIAIRAFEPDPVTFGLLRENLALNGIVNATPVQLAVSSSEGSAVLYQNNPANRGENSLLPIDGGDGAGSRVPTVVLDRYLSGSGLADRTVRFIKLDIEGHEYEALRGAPETLRRCQCLLLEYSPKFFTRHGYDGAAMLDLLNAAGLRPNVFQDGTITPTAREALLSVQGQVNTIWTR